EDSDGLKSVATRSEVAATNKAQRRTIQIVAVIIAQQKSGRARAHEAVKGSIKKAVAEGTVTWCVRLLPSVPRPVAGWYGSPIPESSRRRVLLNVQEARK